MKKPSLLDRLTGAAEHEDLDEFFEEEQRDHQPATQNRNPHATEWTEAEGDEELAVDVYQSGGFVVVKALIAGVPPTNIDIAITRDMVTIKGVREDEKEVQEDGYFKKELFWGSFARTILLPEEVDVDNAEAYEKHGVLVIRLPKINKAKQAKLKVKSR